MIIGRLGSSGGFGQVPLKGLMGGHAEGMGRRDPIRLNPCSTVQPLLSQKLDYTYNYQTRIVIVTITVHNA